MSDGGHAASFADIFAGVELGHTYAQHNPIGERSGCTYAVSMAQALFISAAIEHGGSSGMGGLATGFVAPAPGMLGTHAADRSSLSDGARPVSLPGTARDLKGIVVLRWPHGKADSRECIRRTAESELGLTRQFDQRDYPPAGDAEIEGIRCIPSSWPRAEVATGWKDDVYRQWHAGRSFWDEHAPRAGEQGSDRTRYPNGWYEGAHGKTRYWREYYQAKPASASQRTAIAAGLGAALGGLYGNVPGAVIGGLVGVAVERWFLAPSRASGGPAFVTALMVSGMSCNYRETQDCETLIAFSVLSSQSVVSGLWTYDWDSIAAYRVFGEKLARAVAQQLDNVPLSAEAIRRRQGLAPLANPARS